MVVYKSFVVFSIRLFLQSLLSRWRGHDTFRVVARVVALLHPNLVRNNNGGRAVGTPKSTPKLLHVVLTGKVKE